MDLLINEVAWAGTGSGVLADDEWIELYNPGPSSININGWQLRADDGSPIITLPNASIPAGGYYLLERGDDTTVSDIAADYIYPTYLGALLNTGETLRLVDASGTLIDIANSDGGAWPAGSSTTYGSMERRGAMPDPGAAWMTNIGLDANGNPITVGRDAYGNLLKGTPKNANWAEFAVPTASRTPTKTRTPSKTPTATRTRTPTPFPTPVPIIVINEVMPRAGHDWNGDGNVDVYDEFIEIKNVGILPANLSNYKLDDEKEGGSAPYTLRSLTLDPGERAVFYGSETGILLSDGGDTVLLLNSRGTIVDAYTYAAAEEPDRSFCRLFSNPGYWRENCFPTPGLENGYSGRYPPGPDGSHEPVCLMPDTAPDDFIEAECESAGLGIWNPEYWNTFPGEGEEQWIPMESEKDPAIYN
jgi:hypothetical protein